MIIAKLTSGLGNQLFQYAKGRHLSLMHNVPLKLDISHFQDDGKAPDRNEVFRNYKLGHYNIQADIASEEEVQEMIGLYKSLHLYAKLYRKAVKIIPRHRRRYFYERRLWLYEDHLDKVHLNVYIEGYWQHHRYYQHFPSLILDELTLTEAYKNSYKDSITADDNSVSVHIRRGDYVNHGYFALQSPSYYHTAIKIIKEKVKQPTFYIFSDDLDWVKDNICFKGATSYVEGQADYIDLDLMSKCRHHITANSSFSWWGTFLNRNPNKIIITPKNWVVKPEINQHVEIQFPTWIKI